VGKIKKEVENVRKFNFSFSACSSRACGMGTYLRIASIISTFFRETVLIFGRDVLSLFFLLQKMKNGGLKNGR
jgi:hypothetical protein